MAPSPGMRKRSSPTGHSYIPQRLLLLSTRAHQRESLWKGKRKQTPPWRQIYWTMASDVVPEAVPGAASPFVLLAAEAVAGLDLASPRRPGFQTKMPPSPITPLFQVGWGGRDGQISGSWKLLVLHIPGTRRMPTFQSGTHSCWGGCNDKSGVGTEQPDFEVGGSSRMYGLGGGSFVVLYLSLYLTPSPPRPSYARF